MHARHLGVGGEWESSRETCAHDGAIKEDEDRDPIVLRHVQGRAREGEREREGTHNVQRVVAHPAKFHRIRRNRHRSIVAISIIPRLRRSHRSHSHRSSSSRGRRSIIRPIIIIIIIIIIAMTKTTTTTSSIPPPGQPRYRICPREVHLVDGDLERRGARATRDPLVPMHGQGRSQVVQLHTHTHTFIIHPPSRNVVKTSFLILSLRPGCEDPHPPLLHSSTPIPLKIRAAPPPPSIHLSKNSPSSLL